LLTHLALFGGYKQVFIQSANQPKKGDRRSKRETRGYFFFFSTVSIHLTLSRRVGWVMFISEYLLGPKRMKFSESEELHGVGVDGGLIFFVNVHEAGNKQLPFIEFGCVLVCLKLVSP
jgi:hypothetical protein